ETPDASTDWRIRARQTSPGTKPSAVGRRTPRSSNRSTNAWSTCARPATSVAGISGGAGCDSVGSSVTRAAWVWSGAASRTGDRRVRVRLVPERGRCDVIGADRVSTIGTPAHRLDRDPDRLAKADGIRDVPAIHAEVPFRLVGR